ncbi:prepilin-type N-terminal cleavage/methylation domain-containing protein [Pseudomonas sp. Teo4]|uniref:prepilin-type N-terminal cleavage/methylation domain-containing protein n=1 Tax=Pseudomonas sp. Teo4 TaxID=3064528 RepID=UPI002ABCE5FC|nr:prepilin-type N-terminal cleavage/methylation domain-containing protein [Pseudomonas sp. Teo4]MDZ3993883.1 hypothetical protein [Pseudomonas sp. Teo4]
MRTMEQGVTLLEVLLAVLVVSLGAFAAAAVQLRAMQATESARLDGQAALAAHSEQERDRAKGKQP